MKDPEMLTCRIPRELLYRLQDCADEREVSVSELLRAMIKRSVRRYSTKSKNDHCLERNTTNGGV